MHRGHAGWAVGLCALVAAGPAFAGTFSGAADSPRDAALSASEDLARVVSAFDDESRTWSVTVTLQAERGGDPSAAINASLLPAEPAGGCATGFDDEAARLRASTGNSIVYGIITPARAPRAAQAVSRDADGASVTLVLTDTSLDGFRPGCVHASLTRGHVLDELTVPLAAPGTGPTPTPTPTPPPLLVRFTHEDALLTPTRGGVLTIALEPFDRRVFGAVTVRTRGSGRTLGAGTFRARADDPVAVRVRLTPSARRSLARSRQLPVRLTAVARVGGERVSRTLSAAIRRP